MAAERAGGAGRRLLPALALALLLGLAWGPLARAQFCTLTLENLAFGVYTPLAAAPTDSIAQFAMHCFGNRPAMIVSLSPGSSGNFLSRTLLQGIDRLAYNLYREAARVSIWGDGSGGSQTVTVPGAPGPFNWRTVVVYGRIPPGQWTAAGLYGDTIIITVEF